MASGLHLAAFRRGGSVFTRLGFRRCYVTESAIAVSILWRHHLALSVIVFVTSASNHMHQLSHFVQIFVQLDRRIELR